ncbi:MAG: phosphate/phosphite/phosphonate ABC transporter substrate-binding protein, partial [Opitutaceae bacterium]|nr:phosphate/phosphite/phosphonate ABC transporter substrate-binding protein [Opitutaceae bacterium]
MRLVEKFPKALCGVCLLLLAGAWLLVWRAAPRAEQGGAAIVYGPVSALDNTRHVREWSFAIHPLHNPTHLMRTYQPLLDTLLPASDASRLVAQPSRDYATYEEKIVAGQADFLLPNPWHTLLAMRSGYRVIAMAGRPEDFRGLIIARKDRALREFSRLKGQVVAYPAPTALAACMMPQWMMKEHGLDVVHDIENRYVGSQHSAIMQAYL